MTSPHGGGFLNLFTIHRSRLTQDLPPVVLLVLQGPSLHEFAPTRQRLGSPLPVALLSKTSLHGPLRQNTQVRQLRRDKASAFLCRVPGLYAISKTNSPKNSSHLACWSTKLGARQNHLKAWSVLIIQCRPKTYGRNCRRPSTTANNSIRDVQ